MNFILFSFPLSFLRLFLHLITRIVVVRCDICLLGWAINGAYCWGENEKDKGLVGIAFLQFVSSSVQYNAIRSRQKSFLFSPEDKLHFILVRYARNPWVYFVRMGCAMHQSSLYSECGLVTHHKIDAITGNCSFIIFVLHCNNFS